MSENPAVRFVNIIQAFQAFAGAPLKVTDLGKIIPEETFNVIEKQLEELKRGVYDEINWLKTADPQMAQHYRDLYKRLDKYVK